MIFKLLNATRNLNTAFNIIKTKNMNQEKCYFRYIQRQGTVDITFLLKIKESIRQFNFSRTPDESLQNLFARISTNIQKAIKKAYKKNIPAETAEIDIKLIGPKDNSFNEQTTCIDLFNSTEPLYLQIGSQEYEIVLNAPWVVSLSLPQSILAGFLVYPEYFVTDYADKDACEFKWYKGCIINNKGNEISDIHVNWELVSQNFSYVPTVHDIGMKLKLECTPGNSQTTGPIVESISKNVVEAGPGKCPFELRHMFTTSKLSGKSFRCVTYNILADLYCDSEFTRTVLHPYCPPYALKIDYRKQLILKELLGYNADIFCLQEVDSKIFNHYLQPILETNDLEGLFYKKGKEVAEGLALFYRKHRFRHLSDERIVMSEAIKNNTCLQHIWEAVKNNIPLQERLLDRSTVASATVLQSLENSNELLLVGNTHLYFHPDADHIRLIQGGIFICWLNDLKKGLVEKFPGKRISLILCGDFNSVPSCGIFQLYTTGSAPSTLPDWNSNKAESVHNLTLNQNTTLGSACGTPPYTNFTAGFADCLDYIFYENVGLDVEQVVPLPSVDELRAHTALPSIVFPSDHIALVADLYFK